jgi:hypothetical protein
MHRIIVTGRNDQMPKTISLPFGVGVDGRVITAPVQIAPNQCKCRKCDGWGTVETWDGNPSHRNETVRCWGCDGDGVVLVGGA